ncbi:MULTISPECIES: hypothetical protein [Paenibacillus]|uniref:hypothetical protein n=1 Tax=Paenibacillus TaxID=44249 RepID=UPI00138E05C4|nr:MULTISPECIES: hypothetical protein [Paenibacillus]
MCVATLERTQLLASGNNGNKPPVRVLVALAGGEYNERGRGSDGTYFGSRR